MSSDRTGKLSPTSKELEHFGHQIDSQTSALIESNFVKPLQDSQETQGISPNRHADDDGQETDVVRRLSKSSTVPLISRGIPEDPMNFQDGFQYSKAPTPKALPVQLSMPRNSAGLTTCLNNDGAVRTMDLLDESAFRPADRPLRDEKRTGRVHTEAGAAVLSARTNARGTVSIPSDTLIAPAISGNGRPEEQDHEISEGGLMPGSPFQSTLPSSKPLQQRKGHTRSPIAQLEKYKLPKSISDIQRKARIQSNYTNRLHQPAHHSKPQAEKLSPSMFDKLELHRNTANPQLAVQSEMRQRQGQLAGDSALNEPPRTPETQTIDTAMRSRGYSSKANELSRQSPGGTPKGHNTRQRPMSQASNISKPRAAPGRGHMRTQRKHSSPALEETHALRHKLGRAWNDFFVNEDRRNEHWKHKLGRMKEQLAERDSKVAEYLETIHQQDQEIVDLRATNEEQGTLYEKQRESLAEMERRVQRLRGRVKEYKDHLNNATKEQQNMFKYFQPRYHEMKEQLKQVELNHQVSLEQALSTTNAIRDKIQGSVQEVQACSQQEIQKLNLEIRILEVKLAEREKDVGREKDHANDLRQQLEASHKELTRESNERAVQIKNVEKSITQQEKGIQSLLKILEDNKQPIPNNSEFVETLKVHHTELLDSVVSEFRERVASDRELSSEATEGLKTDISALSKFCAQISEQIQCREDALAWQEKFTKAQMDHQALFRETNQLKEKLASMQDDAKMRLEQNESLQQELFALRSSAEAKKKLSKRVENLEKMKQQTEKSLNEKETYIRALEDQLKEAKEAMDVQNRQLTDKERQLHSEREDHTLTAANHHEQQEQAVRQARAEESAKAQAQYMDLEKRLQDAMQDCSQLREELIQVKQDAEDAAKPHDDDGAHQIQEVADRMNGILEGLQAFGQAKHNLTANLEAWSNDHIELSLLQQAIEKLTKDRQEVIEDRKLLKELLDVQTKLDDTWRYHKSEANALQRAINLEKNVKAEREKTNRRNHKDKRALNISPIINRRVTIQSPGAENIDEDIVPMSIEEERVTRRQASSPTGIMKSPIPQGEGQSEEQYYKTTLAIPKQTREPRWVPNRNAESAPVSHSAYNRPVLGASARVEESAGIRLSERTETVSVGMSSIPKKRRAETKTTQRGDGGRGKQKPTAEKPTKISRSMSSYFLELAPEEPPMQPQMQPSPRGEPIEQRSRPFITYGPPAFGVG
ncbi:hypothetical protein F5Y10DRAFT_260720 [Nemania abortiva]|nr:hypothetical protein F5Y10DRAFT_260720 [Nemania abortiva]